MDGQYLLFDLKTYHSRIRRAREVLKREGLDGLISIAPEHHFYFSGFDSWTGVNSPQVLIFTRDEDEPTLLLRDVDLPLALESTWLKDIRTYQLHSESFTDIVCGILQEKGWDKGRIGMEKQSYAVPWSLGIQLEEALRPVEIIDVTEAIGKLRLFKSSQELALIQCAGRYANLGLAAMNQSCRAGQTEIELAASIESALRNAGSDYWAIPLELTSGDRSAGCHGTPRNREIEPGDLIHAEFAGVCDRYHATAMQTICCERVHSDDRELYQRALESLRAGIAVIRTGVSVADVEAASLEPLVKHNLEQAAMMRFGYGIGIAYPPIWLETLQISQDFETRLESGMAFVLHACLELPEQHRGVIIGGTFALKDSGLQMLAGSGDTELLISN